jgi:hypothetical protein
MDQQPLLLLGIDDFERLDGCLQRGLFVIERRNSPEIFLARPDTSQ